MDCIDFKAVFKTQQREAQTSCEQAGMAQGKTGSPEAGMAPIRKAAYPGVGLVSPAYSSTTQPLSFGIRAAQPAQVSCHHCIHAVGKA